MPAGRGACRGHPGMPDSTQPAISTGATACNQISGMKRLSRAAGVTGTPTFFVNGTMMMEHSLEALSAAIDPLLR